MISPQVPGSGSVRQAILDDQTHRQRDDALGIMAARRGEVVHRGAEGHPAAVAAVSGINDVQVARAVVEQVAHIVQDAVAKVVAVATPAATRAEPAAVVSRAENDQRLGEVFDAEDALCAVGEITPW